MEGAAAQPLKCSKHYNQRQSLDQYGAYKPLTKIRKKGNKI
jgi:hypothetical protein